MLTIISKEKADEFWESIWMQDEVFDGDFVGQIPLLLSLLVSKIVNEDKSDIGISNNGEMISENMIAGIGNTVVEGLASFITYDEYSKNILALFYDKKGKFTIHLYLDFPDEKGYTQVLSSKLVKLIPEGLVNQMKITLKKKEPSVVTANMLE